MPRPSSSSAKKFDKPADPVLAPPFNWRAHLAVHPAAECFPLMKEVDPAGFEEFVSDIWQHGLHTAIVGWASSEGQFLLDGRNRLDALAQLGLLYETSDHHLGIKKFRTKWTELPAGRIDGSDAWVNLYEGNPRTVACSLNVYRRELGAKGKRAAIDALLKLDPSKSDRQIAEQVRSSPTTVGKRRRKAESAGDVSTLDTRIDTRGRQQPAKKPKAPKKPPATLPVPQPAVDDDGAAHRAWHAAQERQVGGADEERQVGGADGKPAIAPEAARSEDLGSAPPASDFGRRKHSKVIRGCMDPAIFADSPRPTQKSFLARIGAKTVLAALPLEWLEDVRAWVAAHDAPVPMAPPAPAPAPTPAPTPPTPKLEVQPCYMPATGDPWPKDWRRLGTVELEEAIVAVQRFGVNHHHLQSARRLNVVLIGALESVTDDFGRIEHKLQAEGQRVPREIAGIVDIVATMNWVEFNDGKPARRALVCTSPNPWHYPAKDRSGKLEMLEPPDLGALIRKVVPPRASHSAAADNASDTTKEKEIRTQKTPNSATKAL